MSDLLRIQRYMRDKVLRVALAFPAHPDIQIEYDMRREAEARNLSTSQQALLSTFVDWSGHARPAPQAVVGNQPVLKYNGRWFAEFDGVDDFMRLASISPSLAQPNVIFIVAQVYADTGATQEILNGGGSGGEHRLFRSSIQPQTTSARVYMATPNNPYPTLWETPVGDWHVYRMEARQPGGNLYRDGYPQGLFDHGSNALDGLSIGAHWNGTAPSKLRVSCIRVYGTDKTAAESEAIEAELYARFNLAEYANPYLEVWNIASVQAVEGTQVIDVDGDGKLDIVHTRSTGGGWLRQGATIYDWTMHEIAPYGTLTGVEGVGAWDFDDDGEVEVILLDQLAGDLVLCKQATADPTGAWNRFVLLDNVRNGLQQCAIMDIRGNGQMALVYAWEGQTAGTGGWNWLEFTGSDVTNPAHWTDHVFAARDGAWAISPTRIDFSGNGAVDLVVGARNARNNSADPGVFILSRPAVVTDPWPLTVVAASVNDYRSLDVGDFYGDGSRKDIISVKGSSQGQTPWPVTIYRHSTGYTAEVIHTFNAITDNVFTIPSVSGRDRFVVVVDFIGQILFEWNGATWDQTIIEPTLYHHLIDNRAWADIELAGPGNGKYIVAADSDGNRVFWARLLV